MTMFSLNDHFDDLVKVTLVEQQTLTETDNIQQEVIDKSAKSQDFFQNNKPSERKYATTRINSRTHATKLLPVYLQKEELSLS